MILSLDANVMVDVLNGRRLNVRDRYEAARASGVRLVTSALAAHEVMFGAMISRRPQIHVPNAEALLEDLEIVSWTHEDGVVAARVRQALRREGWTIGATDALIAGQALARGWGIVSANVLEFSRVPGLMVLDWTWNAESR